MFTVTPGLSRNEMDRMRSRPPYTPASLYPTKQQFACATGEMAGWPYENIVSEQAEATVFAVPDSLLDHTRENTPEVIARTLARRLGGTLVIES